MGAVLVYSTDPQENAKCPKCKLLMPECECKPEKKSRFGTFSVHLRIEKSGRQGKTVTVIAPFPKVESFLKEITKKLKSRCGSGGTCFVGPEGGVIEIQGDKRDMIRPLLEAEGIRVK